jgi:DNA-binding MarR family transcriptional regulator
MQRDTLAFRTLLAVARQRNGLDESRCRLVLEFLSTAATVHAALHRDLGELELTELKLGVLVVLFVLDPSPATPADLATHTGGTRSAMTDVLDQLEARALVHRQRDTQDRRLIYVHLTDKGREAANAALTRYLGSIGRVAGHVEPQGQPQLLALCARLNEGSEQLSAQG